MTDTAQTGSSNAKWKKLAVSTISGAIVGFLGAMAVLRLEDAGAFGAIEGAAVIALLVAMLYIVMAIAVGIGTASPAFGARFLNVEDGEELREMRSSLMASCIGLGALGLMLAIVVLGGEGGAIAPQTSAILATILLVVGIGASMRSRRTADELMREVSRESAALSYYLLALMLGVWASAAHLGFARMPGALDILVAIWSIVLLAVFVATGRRGMLAPR